MEANYTLALPAFCGNRTQYDLLWSAELTINTPRAQLTACFQKTVLVWVPAAWLWLTAVVYLPYLCHRPTLHTQATMSYLNRCKVALGTCLVILSMVDLVEVIIRGTQEEPVLPPPTADYAGIGLLLATLILAVFLTRYSYLKGDCTSGVLFVFWLLMEFCGVLQVTSLAVRRAIEGEVSEVYVFITACVRFGLVSLMFISNLCADNTGTQPAYMYKLYDEKTPLLLDPRTGAARTPQNPCPVSTASFLSKVFFGWYTRMILRGYKSTLSYTDMWDIREEDKSETVVTRFEAEWEKELNNHRENRPVSVTRALFRAYGGYFMFAGLLQIVYEILALTNPQVMNLLITFVQSDSENVWQGYMLAVLMFSLSVLGRLFMNYSLYITLQTGQHVRSAVITAIYRKTLKLSHASCKTTTVGEITNLMSVDAEKLQNAPQFFHFLWITPFTIAIATVFLWQKLGPSCLVGLAYLLLIIPINSFLVGRYIARSQTLQMKFKDFRIKLMSQVLTGIKVLKLYAWETYFQRKIESIRDEELNVLRRSALLSTVNYGISFSAQFVVAVLSFSTFVLSSPENVLTPDIAFVSVSLFNVLAAPLFLVPVAMTSLIQAKQATVSLKRIQSFLLAEEINPEAISHDFEDAAVRMENATFSWGDMDRITLKDMTVTIEDGTLVAVVGAVGCGKTSFINAILGEMEKLSGNVNVNGTAAYVPQQAWIQNMTLRDNILFNRAFTRKKYDQVIEACALTTDLKVLPGGDMTEIGERGINVSGGQKQRISLARAMYQNTDIYLLDDPLSAVDPHVGKHIFHKVIGHHGLLSHKTRIFVTNAITFLPKVDKIIVLQDGRISEMGTYEQLLGTDGHFAEFLHHHIVELDDEDEDSETEELIQDMVRRISLFPRLSIDMGNSPEVSSGLRRRYSPKPRDRRRSSVKPFVKPFEGQESRMRRKSSVMVIEEAKQALTTEEAPEEGLIKLPVVRSYMQAASFRWAAPAVLALLINISGTVGNSIWLSDWSDDVLKANGTAPAVGLRLGIYGLLGVVQIAGVVMLCMACAFGAVQASRRLHSGLLENSLKSPMSFFDTTPLGRILNRFSKDVDTVDADLRRFVQNWMSTVSSVLATLIIITYSTPVFVVVVLPLGVIFIILQRVYVTAARQIKRIDSIKRSPIYCFFSETLHGVSSIRAYGQQDRFIQKSDELLDDSQKVWYTVYCSARWISVWAEVLADMIVLFAAIFIVLSRDTLDPGTVGLSITYALQVSLQVVLTVRSSCELETCIVSVERIKEYTETPTEAPWIIHNERPPRGWPESGDVEFVGYKFRYRPDLDLVLKDLTCYINPGERVGIVGRTGAGKSTMTMALFRLIEAASGSIFIDGQDISKMGLHDIRSCVTIIPQDPVMFSGSLRFNIDPGETYSDGEVWTALEQAHLKDFILALPGTIEYEVGEDGENLSVGQHQLVCLARALLRKTKILVMDEATAAVDLETDDLIQNTIRTEFRGCTVLTIAHRLNTIMDYDRVMVMDAGVVKEFASPQELLMNPASIFHHMAADAGLV